MSRARAGDGDAFRELTEPHRHELQVHCYRMLGSLQDAEDALQETLLAAWRGFEGFEGRASLRTWLYQIATNRCLNARQSASRRPPKEWGVPKVEPPEPTRLGEVLWLEPYPDALLEGAIDGPLGPEARYEQQESISRVRDRAESCRRASCGAGLRRHSGFPASDVAGMLDSTVDSVERWKRGRARAWSANVRPPPTHPSEDAIVAKFVARGVRRSRRAGCPADGRRLHVDTTDALRIRGARRALPVSSRASSTQAAG
jgi:RNA polymerase sigma-70 factor (ECF subfamily)